MLRQGHKFAVGNLPAATLLDESRNIFIVTPLVNLESVFETSADLPVRD